MKYRIDGIEGKPWIVFSNSLGTDMSMWDKQVFALKENYHILRYETGGRGKDNIKDLGMDVIKLMDAVKIQSAHFCGISLGGLIGQWLAINEGKRFLSFTLANTAPKIATFEVWEKRIELVKSEGLSPVMAASPERWFTEKFKENHPKEVQHSLLGFQHLSPEDYIGLCDILKKTDLWYEISTIQTPVLLIAGESDKVTTTQEAIDMSQKIKNSRLIKLSAAHLSNVEDDNFTVEFSRFLHDRSK